MFGVVLVVVSREKRDAFRRFSSRDRSEFGMLIKETNLFHLVPLLEVKNSENDPFGVDL